MTLNIAIIEILKDNINQLDNEDIDIVLALLHKRKCDKKLNPLCRDCSWCGSAICLPISRYFDAWYRDKNKEVSDELAQRLDKKYGFDGGVYYQDDPWWEEDY